jgi:hypothetical protein
MNTQFKEIKSDALRLLRRWLAPGSMEISHVDRDERVGGHVHIWQTRNGHTTLTLVHQQLDDLKRAMRDVARNVEIEVQSLARA